MAPHRLHSLVLFRFYLNLNSEQLIKNHLHNYICTLYDAYFDGCPVFKCHACYHSYRGYMDQIFQNATVKQNVYLCNLLVHSLDSIKTEIALNLSLANIRVTACL